MGDAPTEPPPASKAQCGWRLTRDCRRCLARRVDSPRAIWLPSPQGKRLRRATDGLISKRVRKLKPHANTFGRSNSGVRRGNLLPRLCPAMVGSCGCLTSVHGGQLGEERHPRRELLVDISGIVPRSFLRLLEEPYRTDDCSWAV